MYRALLVLFVCTSFGCGPIDPAPPVDDEGEPIPLPDAFDTWLTVVDITPRDVEIPRRPIFKITFDTYIEDDALLDYDLVYLSSGGIRVGGRGRWVPSERSIYWTPFSALTDGLRYRLNINADRLVSVTGAPPKIETSREFRVRADISDPPDTAPLTPTWGDVDAIFLRKCASCHRDERWMLNPLTRDALVNERGDQVDQLLVAPRDPADSYLMHKILDDYPLRRFGVQPPTWSDAEPLTFDEVQTIERWIIAGAP